ncbi:MAG TPA: dipeptidase [bacterium]|nr:dipeptidase [bacterium]
MPQTAAYPPIFDGHNDTILSVTRTGRSFFERSAEGHIDLPRALEGRLGGGFFAIYVPPPDTQAPAGGVPAGPDLGPAQSEMLSMFGRLLEIAQASGGRVRIVRTAGEIQTCLDGGTFAMLLHLEGAEPLDPEGRALEVFYAAGLRSVGLTHARRNAFSTGVPTRAFPSSPDLGPGLTEAGKTLVRQLNKRKVMIDLSHINERGFWDVAAITDAPLVATHSNAHALCRNPRNLTDKQLDAVRDTRGVAGLNFAVGFLREDGARNPDTPIVRMVDHIEYMVERMGIDHVALGSDFDGTTVPAELRDAAGLPRLVDAVRARGYTDGDLGKLLQGNWVRVLRETWGA